MRCYFANSANYIKVINIHNLMVAFDPTWLPLEVVALDVVEKVVCVWEATVLGRGVLGSLTTSSVTKIIAHPIKASKKSRKVIWKGQKKNNNVRFNQQNTLQELKQLAVWIAN